MMRPSILLLAFLASGIAFGELTEQKRGDFSLTYTVCPQCPFRARFSPDGRQGFLNTARVPPSERPAMAERIFALMKEARSAQAPCAANEPNVFLGLMRRAKGDTAGTTRYITLRNDDAVVRELEVSFADSQLAGAVQVLELSDPADLGVFTNSFHVIVPPHDKRHFRLDGETRLSDSRK